MIINLTDKEVLVTIESVGDAINEPHDSFDMESAREAHHKLISPQNRKQKVKMLILLLGDLNDNRTANAVNFLELQGIIKPEEVVAALMGDM